MKTGNWMRTGVIVAACAVALTFAADEKKPESSAGDLAWQEVQTALRPPPPPAAWKTDAPSKEQIAAYEKSNGVLAGQAADKAKAFYTKYPNHAKSDEARRLELQLLQVAVQLGDTRRAAQFETLQEQRLSDPTFPAEEKMALRAQRVVRWLMDENSKDRAATLAKAEKAVRDLEEDFPKREEPYELLLMVAQGYVDAGNSEKARTLTEDVARKASGDNKEQAQAQLRKLGLVGKPFSLSFKALDGKEVSVKEYAGKVVLIDFWATWCGPCRAALPEVKELYSKYHSKGFDIIGISLDKERDALEKFIADEKMPWPQYFDGRGWENKIAQKYEISSVPTVWLVDKKGNLHDLNGRAALEAKLQQMLAEK